MGLSCPPTSMQSEWVFSHLGDLLKPHYSHLDLVRVNELAFLKVNLFLLDHPLVDLPLKQDSGLPMLSPTCAPHFYSFLCYLAYGLQVLSLALWWEDGCFCWVQLGLSHIQSKQHLPHNKTPTSWTNQQLPCSTTLTSWNKMYFSKHSLLPTSTCTSKFLLTTAFHCIWQYTVTTYDLLSVKWWWTFQKFPLKRTMTSGYVCLDLGSLGTFWICFFPSGVFLEWLLSCCGVIM